MNGRWLQLAQRRLFVENKKCALLMQCTPPRVMKNMWTAGVFRMWTVHQINEFIDELTSSNEVRAIAQITSCAT